MRGEAKNNVFVAASLDKRLKIFYLHGIPRRAAIIQPVAPVPLHYGNRVHFSVKKKLLYRKKAKNRQKSAICENFTKKAVNFLGKSVDKKKIL